ncbi:MAG: glycosyltransferase [Planctomycetota bacterium]
MFADGAPLTDSIDAITHTVSRFNRFGPARRRWMLPVYPAAVADLSRNLARDHAREPFDAVLSTSSAAIKSLRPPGGVPHLCYCHSPARYIWSQRRAYGGRSLRGRVRSGALAAVSPVYRRWDRATAGRVTQFVANSTHTAREIKRCFGRDSIVIHPPVRTDVFTLDSNVAREGFWLVAGALEPYKRVDLAIRAARLAGRDLVIAGSGTAEHELRALAEGHSAGPSTSSKPRSEIRFVGRVDDGALRDLYRRAAVMLYPQIEDFGITSVEAQACGCPVAARGRGGALDSVIPGETGALAEPQAADEELASDLARAGLEAEGARPEACRRNAERFSERRFDAAIAEAVRSTLGTRRNTS